MALQRGGGPHNPRREAESRLPRIQRRGNGLSVCTESDGQQPSYFALAFCASVHGVIFPPLPLTWQASEAFQLGFAAL